MSWPVTRTTIIGAVVGGILGAPAGYVLTLLGFAISPGPSAAVREAAIRGTAIGLVVGLLVGAVSGVICGSLGGNGKGWLVGTVAGAAVVATWAVFLAGTDNLLTKMVMAAGGVVAGALSGALLGLLAGYSIDLVIRR